MTLDPMDKPVIIEKLPTLLRHSPNLKRNIAIVASYLDGETMTAIAQVHGISTARVMQILRNANASVGGGILKGSRHGKARNPSTLMKEKYPYVWDLANELGLSRQAAAEFYRALGKAGSLEELNATLVDKPRKNLTKQIADEVIWREWDKHA
jgi:hypothetical protein